MNRGILDPCSRILSKLFRKTTPAPERILLRFHQLNYER